MSSLNTKSEDLYSEDILESENLNSEDILGIDIFPTYILDLQTHW